MQFQIPQFIEVENKIFGPLSFRQFVYLAGGAGLSFALYSFLPFFVAVIFIIPVLGVSAALAFYKINGKPFIYLIEAMFRYLTSQKLYIWKRTDKESKKGASEKEPVGGAAAGIGVPRLSQSKLRDLSWSLDVHRKIQ